MGTFCDRLGLSPNELNKEVGFRLAVMFIGFYDVAQQSWGKVKIAVEKKV